MATVPPRPTLPTPAGYFDGATATRHAVLVEVQGDYLVLIPVDPAHRRFSWRLDRVRALSPAKTGPLTLTLLADTEDESPRDPARLVLQDTQLAQWIRAAAPALNRRDLRQGTWSKVALYLGGAAAAIALILFVFLPRIADELARRMPIDREVAFGRAVVAQMELFLSEDGTALGTCDSPAGSKALEAMRARLTDGQKLRYDLTLRVLDTDMVNAFAAPGGQVIIMRGLLDEAASPAEVAGVLAHEIGHVEARDPTRLAIRAAGSAGILSLVLGDATGGTLIAVVGDQMLSASYTREAEAAADAFAHRLLTDAGIGTEGLAAFFDRMNGKGIELPEYLSTHPATAGRAEAARAVDRGTKVPVLTEAEWAALQGICG